MSALHVNKRHTPEHSVAFKSWGYKVSRYFMIIVEPRLSVTSLYFVLSRRNAHTFSYKKTQLMPPPPPPPRKYGQRPHSEIPTCIILSYFRPLIRPPKPVMFIFPLLILLSVVMEVLIFVTLYLHSGCTAKNSCLEAQL